MHPFEKISSYIAFIFSLVLALYLIKVLNISYPLVVRTTAVSSEFSVVGEGKVDVIPDTIYIDAGIVVSNAPTADEAQKQISQINNKIIEAMKKLGIEAKDIATSNYSIYPSYDYRADQGKNIKGFSGNATVTIKIKDKELASRAITQAINAGANQIHGTRFVIDAPEKYREEARNKAIENAKQQAEILAKELGIKLGKVVNIVESSPSNFYPVAYKAEALGSGAGAGPQLEPGTQTITSTVTLYFERK